MDAHANGPIAPEHQAKAPGHALVILATSCWMGGLWSDALGETDEARMAGIDRRCNALLRDIDLAAAERGRALADRVPPPAPEEAYYPLRAVEPHIVDALAHKVEERAARDAEEAPHAHDLVVLLRAIAAAARETVQARRAADFVKDDLRAQPGAAEKTADETAAAAKLGHGEGLDTLWRADAGVYAHEARSLGILTALDRMQIARGLPKSLKIETVRTGFADLFGVSAPRISDDAGNAPPGTWLAYLTEVAAVAGHPIPTDARHPQNREPLAWTGVLEGIADRLRADSVAFPAGTPLGDVERAIAIRLDAEYSDEQAAYAAHAQADR
jgi:hypothetical protein